MEVLSNRFKSNFLDLLKCLNSINSLIVFFSLINISVCIYEDQIGKFDWRQTYVGRIKFAQFDTVSTARKIIVATEENVLAALHLKTGQVVWRHVFENSASGDIQLLHVSDKVLTVSGSNPYLVRGWDTATGILLWEWSLSVNGDHAASSWFVQQSLLVHVLPTAGSHIDVTTYNIVTGHNRGATSRLPAVWTNQGCVLSPPFYTCVSGTAERLLLSLDVTSDAVQMISKPLEDVLGTITEGSLRPLSGPSAMPGFIVDGRVVTVGEGAFTVVKEVGGGSAALVDSAAGPLLLEIQGGDEGVALSSYSIATSKAIPEVSSTDDSVKLPSPKIVSAVCTRAPREQPVCRVLVDAADHSATLLQQGGRVVWTREEALANVEAVEFVDLPVSDLEAALESEFDLKEGSIWTSFVRRISTQWQQLSGLLGAGVKDAGAGEGGLVRDYFNLHKIIVLVTRPGKIFGIDNLSGEILWRRVWARADGRGAAVFPRRAARRPPLPAALSVVAKDEETGKALLLSLNPITGELVCERSLRLAVAARQAALLPRAGAEHLHGLVILDEAEDVLVFPAAAARLAENFHMFVAEREGARVQGYALKYDGTKLVALKTWSVSLGGRLWAAARGGWAGGAPSAGRPLADRSVLYKYLNPNLVLLVAEGPREPGKDWVVATVLDAASGAVLAAAAHRRARATPHAFIAEHFMAYVYINEKTRRTEIATMELYEGKERLSPVGPFSSLSSVVTPAAERQAFIVAPVAAAAVTRTERAITHKHALLALTTGMIVEIPWAYLEPRRPLSATAEQREEGLLPYAPELPLPAEAVVNYNRSVQRARRLHAAPAGLESTCLVLATGLDIFYTRVAPSKTFDLLKDDFDYYLITIVLGALVAATVATRHFAARKMLRQAWK